MGTTRKPLGEQAIVVPISPPLFDWVMGKKPLLEHEPAPAAVNDAHPLI